MSERASCLQSSFRLRIWLLAILFLGSVSAERQLSAGMDRINFKDQELFVSGSNVAWINFARDIGPGTTHLDQFSAMFSDLRAHGGNTMRLWLHTDGRSTPEWSGTNVIGPGVGAINDLRDILDLAHRHNVSLMLCLWSFDMLRISHGETVTNRAYAILTEPAKRQLYIDHALIPMVAALKGHPAILAWEIFNEAEGMSHEFGWNFNRHVPMADIQAFVNQTAGAIKVTDPDALVTTGTWSFLALTDILNDNNARNYYRDDRLMAAGGNRHGRLDFYTVHYYTWAGTRLSPFHHDVGHWQLDKPVVVAEFYSKDDIFGVAQANLYKTLYERGYAGALGWQWVDHAQNRDNNFASWPTMLTNMLNLHQLHRADVSLLYPSKPEPGLRHHWRFEDNPTWLAGSVSLYNTATPDASAVLVTPVADQSLIRFRELGAEPWTGRSLFLGGTGSRAELGSIAPREDPFTIAFWFKIESFDAGSGIEYHLISAEGGGALAGEWSVHLRGTARDAAAMGGPALVFRQEGAGTVVLAEGIGTGRWVHLTLVRDTAVTGNFRIYVDGKLAHYATNHVDFVNSERGVFIGARPTTPVTSGFVGWFDDVRFYDTALQHLGQLWGDGYGLWAREVFGDNYGREGTRAHDISGGGQSNFARYVFGAVPQIAYQTPGQTIQFGLRPDSSVSYHLETSFDLTGWQTYAIQFKDNNWSFLDEQVGTLHELDEDGSLSILQAVLSNDGIVDQRAFFRLKVPFPE